MPTGTSGNGGTPEGIQIKQLQPLDYPNPRENGAKQGLLKVYGRGILKLHTTLQPKAVAPLPSTTVICGTSICCVFVCGSDL
jgi:hypothetical protein